MDRMMIFDIGAHIGEDSDFYLRKGFRVVAVEADPALCRGLRQRFSNEIIAGRFILVDRAIAEKAGTVNFFVNSAATIWSSIREEYSGFHGTTASRIRVPSITFGWLLEQFGVPYYLKIDIEGADMLCVEALINFPKRPQFLSIEIDHRSLLRNELSLLTRLGYSRFQLVDQTTVPDQPVPFPTREGEYIDYPMQLGMSGLFGNDLPDRWLSKSAVQRHQAQMILRNRLRGLCKRVPSLRRFATGGSWYDLHAAISLNAAELSFAG
jgi:FkbM family methyltransferase